MKVIVILKIARFDFPSNEDHSTRLWSCFLLFILLLPSIDNTFADA